MRCLHHQPGRFKSNFRGATPVRSRDSDFDYTYDSHDKQGGCFNLFEGYLRSMLQSHACVMYHTYMSILRVFQTSYLNVGVKPV
ncbi:hypothetical protein HanRHA438_Chr08g0358921 [Helianthus annuus]|uniref:Uncharacterized protein n=1 Tax=Helianthus annuus TaxID=4232 RepID=A0A9K3IFJ0_HELAN|nr:hypothetical protein HanXRQr2_Chr08g0346711 [Helianthus annuus]KAJ0539455.1 hypothetical protein HanHA300_Chr08g0286461 [Helianthus annuus]KAJ0554154.1 hypothetical protein HanHA89_Chr08g0304491 [Helianthus annuus]KAJ0719760.1 hypothetical protein HanLR1_Chr08g0285341 [Helianthus annuus]KAJ0722981.1 hypothetical protein HanOQP8_Chr08g0292811 [Helianthus annuus]